MSFYQKAYFSLSAAEVKQLPPDEGIEVAIVGRSNAGKSSVLNKVTHNKHLARVSKTPGRTQLINVFILDKTRRLIDLPGYGYAKVPLRLKQKWHTLLDRYIRSRQSLKGLILVMDIRHPLQELDILLLNFCKAQALSVHVLLNKADKLSKQQRILSEKKVKDFLLQNPHEVTLQFFSAQSGLGLKELETILDQWYQLK